MKKENSIQTGNKQRTLWQETWRRFKRISWQWRE